MYLLSRSYPRSNLGPFSQKCPRWESDQRREALETIVARLGLKVVNDTTRAPKVLEIGSPFDAVESTHLPAGLKQARDDQAIVPATQDFVQATEHRPACPSPQLQAGAAALPGPRARQLTPRPNPSAQVELRKGLGDRSVYTAIPVEDHVGVTHREGGLPEPREGDDQRASLEVCSHDD